VIDAGDVDGSVDRSRDLMRSINDCLRPDGIRVSERRIDDAGFALSVVRATPRPVLDRRTADEHLRLVRGTTS
jgi:Ribonuclease G/E